jgi:hypothetical protein
MWSPLRPAWLRRERESVFVVCPELLHRKSKSKEEQMRLIGLDAHQSFCEVAIHENAETRFAGRISTNREELELFAQSLDPADQVALEASGRRLRSPGS